MKPNRTQTHRRKMEMMSPDEKQKFVDVLTTGGGTFLIGGQRFVVMPTGEALMRRKEYLKQNGKKS